MAEWFKLFNYFNYLTMNRVILHIDFDSYFASCEQQFDPSLRDRPIGVTAANGRTCIIAASKEAKKKDVKSVTRVWEAKKLCPEIITVPAHFERYWEITQKFLDICKDYTPYIELFSLDEVFMDITSTKDLFGGQMSVIYKIRKRIEKEIGSFITVSVGLSHNKLLAKLASGINKPNGFLEISGNNVWEIYEKAKLTDVCGIGERIAIRLNRIGIFNLLDLREASIEILEAEFGKAYSQALKNIGMARDDLSVIPYYTPQETKSVGRNYCLPKNECDQRIVLQNIFELSEEIGIKLRRLGKKARTVGLSLRGAKNYHGRKTVSDHIDSGKDIYSLCKLLYDEWDFVNYLTCGQECRATCPERSRRMVRQISVWARNLEDADNLTLSLFDQNKKSSKLQRVVDGLNDRFGDHTIRNGFLTDGPNLKTVPNGFMADRLERQKVVEEFTKCYK